MFQRRLFNDYRNALKWTYTSGRNENDESLKKRKLQIVKLILHRVTSEKTQLC